MSVSFSVIRCAPRKRRRSLLTKLALFMTGSALAGWVVFLTKSYFCHV